jgi:hypothetical protein
MKIFLSQSGTLSNKIAHILRKELPGFIHAVKPFVSDLDIPSGNEWFARLMEELANTQVCIICLTKTNLAAPWIHFEAGAITQTSDTVKPSINTFLIDVPPTDIKLPLNSYQFTRFTKSDFFQLIKTINNRLESDRQLPDELLKESFDAKWPTLNQKISEALRETTDVSYDRDPEFYLEKILTLTTSINEALVKSPMINEDWREQSADRYVDQTIQKAREYGLIALNPHTDHPNRILELTFPQTEILPKIRKELAAIMQQIDYKLEIK